MEKGTMSDKMPDGIHRMTATLHHFATLGLKTEVLLLVAYPVALMIDEKMKPTIAAKI